jgi:hypothetical protein
VEADHPADLLLAHQGQLKPVVGSKLLAGAADEVDRVVESLSLRPGKPTRQAIAFRFDQRVQLLLRIGRIEETEVRTPPGGGAAFLRRNSRELQANPAKLLR